MDLKGVLRQIFKEKREEKIDEIHMALKKVKCNSKDDLKYLDEDILKDTILKSVERKKLLFYIAIMKKSKTLRETLEKIFGDKDQEKLEKIKSFFEKQEIYTSEDLGIFDLDIINEDSAIFTQQDAMKIRNHIRKEYPDTFEDIKAKEEYAEKKEAIECDNLMKSREANDAQRVIYLESLFAQKEMIEKSATIMAKELSKLFIPKPRSQKIKDSLKKISPWKNVGTAEMNPDCSGNTTYGAKAELEGQTAANCSKIESTKEQLLKLKQNIDDIDDEIKRVLAMEERNDFLESLSSNGARHHIEN